jgi:hypothetical protein
MIWEKFINHLNINKFKQKKKFKGAPVHLKFSPLFVAYALLKETFVIIF